jgi:hypothetical protein
MMRHERGSVIPLRRVAAKQILDVAELEVGEEAGEFTPVIGADGF